DCRSVQLSGYKKTGIYPIWLQKGYRFVHISCDMDTIRTQVNTTGWIILQQRINGNINFQRGWLNYVEGFGNPNEDYWVGLENIVSLSRQKTVVLRSDLRSVRPVLRVDLTGWDGFKAYAEYDSFALYEEKHHYQLASLQRGVGTAVYPRFLSVFLSVEFITFDNINNGITFAPNCPSPQNGGWWYSLCSYANLNGKYPGPTDKMSIHNIYWLYWSTINKKNTALRYVSMK
uniref:Fibrinogen C-terminal domain-containing protein n=1 Tax=Ciona savignyi TaxID=51511 RepID=H2Y6Q4_CIOSA